MKPLPWSYTALSQFKNCPHQYHEVRVTKRVKDVEGMEATWGKFVHERFDLRQSKGEELPASIFEHEPFMQRLERVPGVLATEQRIALDKRAQPCAYFSSDVWFRGVIDWKKVDLAERRASIVDYKTGKPRSDFTQLNLFALHIFALHSDVDVVDARYYWTQTGADTRRVIGRAEVPSLWAKVLPDLRQYVAAFKADIWQKRQSGLCNGYCPVSDCEFWSPRRKK